jgi:hypothetical protein
MQTVFSLVEVGIRIDRAMQHQAAARVKPNPKATQKRAHNDVAKQ